VTETERSNASLSPALDPGWLRENLPRYLWREGETPGEITELEISRVWRPRKRIRVLYQLALSAPNNQVWRQTYAGFSVPAGRFPGEYKSILRQGRMLPSLGRAVVAVPEAELVLLAFPNDRRMHLLSEKECQRWLKRHLPEVLGNVAEGEAWQVQETKLEMLRYVPDKRFTVRCRATITAKSGLEKKVSFIAKQLNNRKKAKMLYRHLISLRGAWSDGEIHRRTGRASQRGTQSLLRIPRALGLYEKRAVVFLEEIAGKNLAETLPEIDLGHVIGHVGELLAIFHSAQKRVKKKISRESELAEVRWAIRTIAGMIPNLRRRLKRLYKKFQVIGRENDAPVVLLHGTFRLNHIFIRNGELSLVDLDSLRMGHPAYDLSNFLSSLYYFEAQRRISLFQRRNIARYFLEGYVSRAPRVTSPKAVMWFLVSLLINKQGNKYVTHLHEDREEKVEQMLTLAEFALEKCQEMPEDSFDSALWSELPEIN
jgi:thiamine kinase-like enzyme